MVMELWEVFGLSVSRFKALLSGMEYNMYVEKK